MVLVVPSSGAPAGYLWGPHAFLFPRRPFLFEMQQSLVLESGEGNCTEIVFVATEMKPSLKRSGLGGDMNTCRVAQGMSPPSGLPGKWGKTGILFTKQKYFYSFVFIK